MILELATDTQISQATSFQDAKPSAVGAQFLTKFLYACWQRVCGISRRPPRRLRLCESLGLGDRRFVAVVEFDQRRFLIGGTSASLVLLARLENDQSHHAVSDPRKERC